MAQSFSFDGLFANNVPAPKTGGMAKRGKYDFAVAYPDPDSLPLDGLLESLKQGLDEEGARPVWKIRTVGTT